MIKDSIHKPVLLKEVITALDPQPADFVIDGTVDGGGHMQAILSRLGKQGIFLGIDWDGGLAARCAVFAKALAPAAQTVIVHGNFRDLPKILKEKKLMKADCLLLDLGFSSEQLAGGRGFSFSEKDSPLTMTYDFGGRPLAELLEKVSQKELARVIRDFGEERYADRIAAAIKKNNPKITGDLAAVIAAAVPANYRRGRLNPATRTFMALRIWANRELENVSVVLGVLPDVMARGGRVAIISFHSLEDRLVKNVFRDLARSGKAKLLSKKPVTASLAEKRANPASRSAKLRAIQFF